jgi:hypothetical protein
MSSCVCPTNMKFTYTSLNTPLATNNEIKQSVYLFLLSEQALSNYRFKTGRSDFATTGSSRGGEERTCKSHFPPTVHQIMVQHGSQKKSDEMHTLEYLQGL